MQFEILCAPRARNAKQPKNRQMEIENKKTQHLARAAYQGLGGFGTEPRASVGV